MEGAPVAGRTIFATLSTGMVTLFYIVAAVAVAAFLFGVWRRIVKYRKGKGLKLEGSPLARLAVVLWRMVSHSRIGKRNLAVGLAHGAIFLGFFILFAGTATITVDQDILAPISPALRFWRGLFYQIFSAFLDLAGLALVAGLAFMAARRWLARPPRLDYRRPDRKPESYNRRPYAIDDAIFLFGLLLVVVTGFAAETMRIGIDRPPFERWSVIGWALADALENPGFASLATNAHPYAWWVHAVLALAFIAYLPYAKSAHMVLGLVSLYVRDPKAGRRLPPLPEEGDPGYGSITDFTWAELVQLDACTKCGRCHAACPAHAGGWPLSPRDVILELRENAEAALGPSALFRERSDGAGKAGLGVAPETLWSCTTCLACVETCPVEIQHVPMIVQMRRRLVEQGNFESSVQTVLERLAQSGNSFGEPEAARADWVSELDFPIKDARVEPVDVLWFVGDFASFDPRIRQITLSTARVFQAGGLDFGILRQAERNAGNDIRRIGEEGLYGYLVEQNMAALAGARYRRIVTTDPHSYNTLKREYPDLGARIFHHSEIILELIEQGRIARGAPGHRRVTYHDPCHLARYNDLTEAPRALLEKIGVELVEMERHRANSFCCGGGGGRIWMASKGSAARPADQRIAEARRLEGVDTFVTACPKCFVMQSEAAKETKGAQSLQVLDIVQLVEEGLALPKA